MTSTPNTVHIRSCACGCGRTFAEKRTGAFAKRFASDDCRMEFWRARTRRIKDDRPRSHRAHRGTEFQLDEDHIELIDTYGQSVGAADRSAALRHLLDSIEVHPLGREHP